MPIIISQPVEREARERAQAEGVTIEAYVERLILEDQWIESTGPSSAASDKAALDQMDRGAGLPAREAFAALRAKHGIPH